MAEPKTRKNYPKRVVFEKGKQKDFLIKMQEKSCLGSKEFAKLAGVHIRTMNDWKREKFSVSLPSIKKICKKANNSLPKNIEIKNSFWYVNKGSKNGGIAVYKKHGVIGGDPSYRIKKWHEWWRKEGKFKKGIIIGNDLPIRIPKKSSELAEFIGIILGDGCIASNQVMVTLHRIDDQYFASHVKSLFKKLFDVNPSIYNRKDKKAVNITVSRIRLVRFLVKNGLNIGGKVKQQVGVPEWIKKKNCFSTSCLKGLFDTDGCFYIDRHSYKDKIHLNCGINFTNRSIPILNFFKDVLEKSKLHPTKTSKFSISLRREKEIIEYFKEVGSSNPKHLSKFKNYYKNKYGEVPKWLERSRFENG